MKLRAFALTAVTAGALGLAGCGDDSTSGGGGSDQDARALLTKTFDGSSDPIKSGTIEFTIGGEITGKDSGKGDMTAKIALNEAKEGSIPPFQAEFSVKGEAGKSKLDESFGATFIDDRFFVNYDETSYDVGAEFSKQAIAELKKQQALAEKQAGAQSNEDLVKQLGLEPQTWLKDPKVDGEEKVGDDDTYRITGEVDIRAMVPDILEAAKKAEQIAPSTGAKQEIPDVSEEDLKKAEEQIESLEITIWTGKDDTVLRKLSVDTVIKGDKSDEKLDGAMTLSITNLNEDQEIKAPSKTAPITDLLPKLQGLAGAFGGAGAMGGGSGAASPVAPSASGDVSQELLDCVSKAGGDQEKLAACQGK